MAPNNAVKHQGFHCTQPKDYFFPVYKIVDNFPLESDWYGE